MNANLQVDKAWKMALCNKRLWKLLVDRGMAHTQMRLAAGLSASALAKLPKGEDVNPSILVMICDALGCGIRDIVDSAPRELRRMKKEFYK